MPHQPIVTLPEVKAYLGIPDTDTKEDVRLRLLLDAMIEWARGQFESFGLKLEQTTITEVRDGGDLGPKPFTPFDAVFVQHGVRTFDSTIQVFDHIFTAFRPIITVTSVHDSNDNPPVFDATTLLDVDDFRVITEQGLIRRLDGNTFFIGIQNVQLVYDAGFHPIPDDISLAVMQGVDQFLSKAGRGALQSERLGEYSYVLKDVIKQMEDQKFLLNRYLRPGTQIVGA